MSFSFFLEIGKKKKIWIKYYILTQWQKQSLITHPHEKLIILILEYDLMPKFSTRYLNTYINNKCYDDISPRKEQRTIVKRLYLETLINYSNSTVFLAGQNLAFIPLLPRRNYCCWIKHGEHTWLEPLASESSYSFI